MHYVKLVRISYQSDVRADGFSCVLGRFEFQGGFRIFRCLSDRLRRHGLVVRNAVNGDCFVIYFDVGVTTICAGA